MNDPKPCLDPTYLELLAHINAMRAAQKRFFRNKYDHDLKEAKQLEKELDAFLVKANDAGLLQPDLFSTD